MAHAATGTPSEVLREFLRLGLTGFGGPSAHVALFRQRFVRELHWIDERAFIDAFGAANLLPGPTSTEMALSIGQARAGRRGLLAAGFGFILPAAVMVLLLALAYERFGSLDAIAWALYGIQPVVVAIVALAVAGLAPTALRGVAFGSGYVLVAFLRTDLVQGLGLLNDRQLLDAVAAGQVTPGPVYTAATFVGYLLAGVPGAVVATIAIFLPAFVGVALIHPVVPRLRSSPVASALLDGVNAASLGLMAAVTIQLGRTTVVDAVTLAFVAGSLLVLLRWPRSAVALMVLGAASGVLVHAAGLVR